ncbi:MAG: hypothetical protein CVU69_04935 [Deltaproteobacteria bacterium HGW-Deltaproteobacteria-4]|nr:MAG: hypothetical protein CVU69_04935 [Deltaproteobacteria bacterium HGW-Deltaproteobacteria-4]
MFFATQKYLKNTGANSLTVKDISKFLSQLPKDEEYKLGVVKGFWLQWFDWDLPGIDKDVADFLEELILSGNTKGEAVAKGCPYSGPLTELEQSALLDWAVNALQRGAIRLTEYAYFLCLMLTGRRAIQIQSLRAVDLPMSETPNGNNFTLNVPRAKQRGGSFRGEFRTIPISDELHMTLKCLVVESKSRIEKLFSCKLPPQRIKQLPIFIEWGRLGNFSDFNEVEALLKNKPDYLHATQNTAGDLLRTFLKLCEARSERTGDFITLTSRRFRYTKGTNLARRGISGTALALSLDHSDTQNIDVYTENTSKNAEVIEKIMAPVLAPMAQACVGKLINSERDALREKDPNSRVYGSRDNPVGNCGSHGFCAIGYRGCYTCTDFQPWRDAPHHEVLDDLIAERQVQQEEGVSLHVIQATDRLLLAVQWVMQLCEKAKAEQCEAV